MEQNRESCFQSGSISVAAHVVSLLMVTQVYVVERMGVAGAWLVFLLISTTDLQIDQGKFDGLQPIISLGVFGPHISTT